MNTQDASVDYFEKANLRLEDAILTLQLLLHSVWQSEDSVRQDFKTIIEAVLTKVRFVARVMTKYEEGNSFEATVSNSFACPTTQLILKRNTRGLRPQGLNGTIVRLKFLVVHLTIPVVGLTDRDCR